MMAVIFMFVGLAGMLNSVKAAHRYLVTGKLDGDRLEEYCGLPRASKKNRRGTYWLEAITEVSMAIGSLALLFFGLSKVGDAVGSGSLICEVSRPEN